MATPNSKSGPKVRPTSPHLTIYAWTVTMAASITHRVTGVLLGAGFLVLGWWLVALAMGPPQYARFARVAAHPLGQIVLYAFVWALAFHLLNGVRHLVWDVGYGFKPPTAKITGVIVYLGSFVAVAFVFLHVRGLI
jgi:succinate dehydrogenase / fumarate reductase cytochrome b subunit